MGNTFDENFNEYVTARPSYPDSIFQNFMKYCKLSEKSHCLEIGAGHGIATEIISLLWKANIIAIEPGESLFNYAQSTLSESSNVSFFHTTFEEFVTTDKFDCIYAATAFHWLNPDVKFKKSHELLKANGILFLFWNYFDLKDPKVGEDIQQIYKEYHPQEYQKIDPKKSIRAKIENRKREIEDCGLFNLINHFETINPAKFSAEQYIKLLKTFPNNSYPDSEIEPFFKAIEKYIWDNGNLIELDIIVCSEIAQKK